MKYYLQFWKRIFDYKGSSSKKEYIVGLTVTGILAIVTMVCSLYAYNNYVGFPYAVLLIVLWFLTILHFVPMLSLTVRRLRDSGRSYRWIALAVIVGLGWIVLTTFCLTDGYSSSFFPQQNIAVGVYGCPEFFDPASEEPVEVYGPPAFFDEEEEEETSEEAESDSKEMVPELFDPYINVEPDVYGPPEFFEEREREKEDIEETDPDFSFDVSVNIQPLLYGPPEILNAQDEDE